MLMLPCADCDDGRMLADACPDDANVLVATQNKRDFRATRLPVPTQHRGGSSEKIAVLRARVERGEILHHPLDAKAPMPGARQRDPSRPRYGRMLGKRWAPVAHQDAPGLQEPIPAVVQPAEFCARHAAS